MNENQKNFLNEFHDLLRKYSVKEIFISCHSGDKKDYRIAIGSNGQKLEFMGYSDNCFLNVGTYDGDYKAKEVKHGKWEQDKCTNCGKSLEDLFEGEFYYDLEEIHFCPNCGARMDGDSE